LQPAELAQALEAVASRLGIAVRYEKMDRVLSRQLGAGGGFCRVRGKPIILVDESLRPRERVALLAKTLGSFDLDGVYLPAEVRAIIRSHGASHVLVPRPLARAKPNRRGKND
jgi:hypothetical protein